MTAGELRALLLASTYLLGAVNYYLGWLLVSLPTGHRGLRSAGWELIEDGGLYVVFGVVMSGIDTIIHATVILSSVWGPGATPTAVYADFHLYVDGLLSYIVAVIAAITGGISVVAAVPHAGPPVSALLASVFGPIQALLSTTVLVLFILKHLGTMLQDGYLVLALAGAILYGLPKRVGRGVGAGLISFALVFYLGLPLLPGFVDFFASYIPVPETPDIPGLLWSVLTNPTGAVHGAVGGISRYAGYFIFKACILPLLYLSILGAVSAGLARSLGGWGLRLPGL